MFSLRQYIEEQATKGLTIFDIDETMFKTKAKVKVIKNGETIKSLTNQGKHKEASALYKESILSKFNSKVREEYNKDK